MVITSFEYDLDIAQDTKMNVDGIRNIVEEDEFIQ